MRLFTHLQPLSIGFYSRNRAGVIISRMTNDVEALDQLVEDGLATLIQSGLTLIGVVVILFVLDPHLALLTFLALPILAVGAFAFRIASADAYRLTREKIAAITGYLQETLSGIRVVRAFGQEPRAHRAIPRAQRREPGGEHDDRQPERRVLPRRRVPVGAGHGRDPRDRRDRGDQRPHVDRRRCSRSSRRSTTSSTRSSSSRSSTRPTSPGWPRSTRSSSCSTSSPTSPTRRTRRRCRRSAASSASTTSRSGTAPPTAASTRCATSTS